MNITDAAELEEAERAITTVRSAEIAAGPAPKTFDFATLKTIHKTLFQEVYSWAGTPRDVRIAKTSLFCNPQFIDQSAQEIFQKLKDEKYLQGLPKEQFIDRLAYYMGEVNALHPFREGNGRTQRLFFTQLAKAAGYNLDFTKMDKERLLQADIEAMRFRYEPLKNLIQENIEPIQIQKTSIKEQIETIKEQRATPKPQPQHDKTKTHKK